MKMNDFTRLNNNEKPLDNLVSDGGYTAILREIVCVGDSLSSGEFEHIDANGNYTFHDKFDYSWGQFMARSAGVKVYNFSRGGMTAKEYMESFAEANNFFNPEIIPNAYIIALGVNDLLGQKQPLGEVSDIDLTNPDNNKKTFAGWYGQLIQKYKAINPNAKFFFVSMPKENSLDDVANPIKEKHAQLLHELTKVFSNSYVIDLYEYLPVLDAEFKEKFYLEGHLNPAGYRLLGVVISSYIDYIIKSDFKAFKQVGFIGTEYYKKELE